MKVCLDNIIFALQRAGGISVYWSELLKHFIATGTEYCVVERPEALGNIQRGQLAIPAERIIADAGLPLKLGRYLPVAEGGGADLFLSSYYRWLRRGTARQVVTVYDFTYELYRSGMRRAVHRWQKRTALRDADGIICISDSTRRDLLRLYPEVADIPVEVIPLGVSPSYRPLDASEEWPHEFAALQGERYVMFVGDRSDYKNFGMAVEALRLFGSCCLAIVGGGALGDDERRMLDERLPGAYRHLGSVSEEQLNALYNKAFALLYPSSYEGFGLPPLEAMRAGCPVVAVNSSSLPEVCGEAAMLVTAASPTAFAECLTGLLGCDVRDALVEKGFHQAARFVWGSTWERTTAFYSSIMAADRPRIEA